jgi:hypothetical protein
MSSIFKREEPMEKSLKIKKRFGIKMAFFLLFLLVLCFLSIVWTSLRVGISPMPTSAKVLQEIDLFLPTNIEGKIYELGSGFGSLALFLSQRFPHCRVVGFELSFFPFLISLFWKGAKQRKNLFFQRRDFFEVSFFDATLVTCYLFPKAMERLKEKLQREMPKGALILSHTFAFRNWKPIKIIEAQDLGKTKIYLYQV